MRSFVTGGTGFVGQHLVRRLERPVVAGRDPHRIRRLLGSDVIPCPWQLGGSLNRDLLPEVDTVFHLAGEPVASGRWNTSRKQRIMDSRVLGTRNLVAALAGMDRPPRVLVCASAIGYYGARGDEPLAEDAAPGTDFLARVCQAWEAEAGTAAQLGIRVVSVRIGVVLGRGGGALARMLPPFRLGLGGRIGSGDQFMSWIHIDDLVGILLHAATTGEVQGPVNGVAPRPVRNREFTATLASVLHRPALMAVPAWVLRAGVGEFAETLLGSQKVVPEKILQAGYSFLYPELRGALGQLLG